MLYKFTNLTVEEQTIVSDTKKLVSDTVNVYKCKFEFDSDWDSFTKTAVFMQEEGTPYESILDQDNTCIIPWEAITEEGVLYIGVYGVNESQRYPTIWTKPIKVQLGCKDGEPHVPPTPDVYEQILVKYAEAIQKISDESIRATDKENELEAALNNEIQRAITREDEIESKIDGDCSELKELIEQETQRAVASEQVIIQTLDGEVTRAESRERELANSISDLNDDLQDEITARTNNDAILNTAISNEKTRAENKELELASAISDEVNEREQSDSNLLEQLNLLKTQLENLRNELTPPDGYAYLLIKKGE